MREMTDTDLLDTMARREFIVCRKRLRANGPLVWVVRTWNRGGQFTGYDLRETLTRAALLTDPALDEIPAET
jgi:hypothetical protein